MNINTHAYAPSSPILFGRNDYGSPRAETPQYHSESSDSEFERLLVRNLNADSFEQMERGEQALAYQPVPPARRRRISGSANAWQNFEHENRNARQNQNLETDALPAELTEEEPQVVPVFSLGDRLILPTEVRNSRSDSNNPLFNFMTSSSFFDAELEPRRVTFEARGEAVGEATGIDQLLNLAIAGEERAPTTRADAESSPDENLNHPLPSRLHRSERLHSGRLMGRDIASVRDRASLREAQNAPPRFESEIENRGGVGVARPHYDLA